MSIRRFLALAVLVVGFSMSAAPVKAMIAPTDFSGRTVDMGALAIGQHGTIDATTSFGTVLSIIGGSLPSYSMVTFTYNFAGVLLPGALLSNYGSYDYTDGAGSFSGVAGSIVGAGGYASGVHDGAFSTALAFASSDITGTNVAAATSIIRNDSAGAVEFMTLFLGLVLDSSGFFDVTYAVSAVPLPAALPLFGAGLAAFAGLRRRKKKAVAQGVAA